MRRRMLTIVLPVLLACAKSTTTPTSGAAPATENDTAGRQALSKLEDDWARALETHDTTFFVRVVAPDFHGTADSGATFGRAEVIGSAADTATITRDVQDQDRQIRIYGDGTVGVVTGHSTWTVASGERPGPRDGRYTEVWVKQPDGSWQVVAGHYSMAPAQSAQ